MVSSRMKPTQKQVIKARAAAGHTWAQAAATVYVTVSTWARYEAMGKTHSPMSQGLWELYLIKTGQK